MFSVSTYLDLKSKKYLIVLSILLFLLFALRYFCGKDFMEGDSQSYLDTANFLKSGKYFQPTTDPAVAEYITLRPFVYPLFLLIFGGLAHAWLIVFLQTFVGIFNVFLTLLFYKKLNGKSPGLVAFFLVFTPSVFIFVHLLMTEIFTTTFTMFLAVLLVSKMSKRNITLIQITLTALAFIKPAFFPFIFISFLLFAGYFIKTKQFYWAIFIPIICVFSYVGFNKYRTGYANFSSIENINLISYNVELFKANEIGEPAARKWVDSVYAESDKFKTYNEKSKYLASTGFAEIKNNFFSYTFYHLYCSARAMIDPGRSVLMLYFSKENQGTGIANLANTEGFVSAIKYYFNLIFSNKGPEKTMVAIVNLLAIPICLVQIAKWLLIFYLAIKKREKRIPFQFSYLFIFVLYGIFITGPVAYARYLIPIQGIIIAFAALGWEQFKARKKNSVVEVTA